MSFARSVRHIDMMNNPQDTKFPKLSPRQTSLVAYPMAKFDHGGPPHQCDRNTLLEWRLGVQESITVGLLEKISVLKAEMLEQLKYTKRMDKDQSGQNTALHQELHELAESITAMNSEVQAFEENVRDKWRTVNAAAVTLRNLENHHVNTLADVRSRITRGDQAISALSQKLSQMDEEFHSLSELYKRDLHEVHSLLKSYDHRNADFTSQLERSELRGQTNVQKAQDDLQRQLLETERRLMNAMSDTHQEFHTSKAHCLNERHRMESKLMESMNGFFHDLEHRIMEAENKAIEVRKDEELIDRVDELEKELSAFKQQILKTFKEVEVRMNRMSDEFYEHHRNTMDSVKEEMRQGFSTAHDTITNMKAVLESKMRISEENIHLELGQLRKLVVLV